MSAIALHVLVALVLGFVGCALVLGPVALLVARFAVSGQPRAALAVGAGAAVAEGLWIFAAYLGAAWLLSLSGAAEATMQAVGAVCLIAGGLFAGRRGATEARVAGRGAFAVGFVFTALNMPVVLAWAAAIAATSDLLPVAPRLAPVFAISAGSGVFAWFALCVLLLGRLQVDPARLDRVAQVAGWVLVGMGVVGLAGVLWR